MTNNEEKMILVSESLLNAVAHIGVDFCYGPYELSKEDIQQVRDILESASNENEITHKYDPDYSCLEFFVNGELFCTWSCEDQNGLCESVKTFKKIYELGKSEQADARIASQQREINELKAAVSAVRKSDCGAWLKDCTSSLFSCSDGKSKRMELMKLLDSAYKLLGENNG